MKRGFYIALRAAIIAPLLAQAMQIAQSFDIALSASAHPIAQPILFARNFAVELVLGLGFAVQFGIAPILKMAEMLPHQLGAATVKPDGLIGHIAQKAAVMADQNQGRINLPQRALKPFNGRQVEMIGRLVKQQHFRTSRHGFGQRDTATLATRHGGNIRRRLNMQIRDKLISALAVFIIHQPLQDKILSLLITGKAGILRQIFDMNAGLHKTLAIIRLDQSGENFQQGRFARAIAPHQTNAIIAPDRERSPRQKRRHTMRQVNIINI